MKIWFPALTVLLLASACGGGNSTPPGNYGDDYTVTVPSGATERTENKIILNAKDPSKVKNVEFIIRAQAIGDYTSETRQNDNSFPYEISLNNVSAGNVSISAYVHEASGKLQIISANFNVEKARTEIKGDIKSDSTWTKENSPYVIMDTIYIDDNVHLNIQPGVIVRGGEIRNYGTINAKGTLNDPVIFEAYLSAVSQEIPGPATAIFSHSIIKSGFLFGNYYDRGTITVEDSIIDLRNSGSYIYPNVNINLYRNRIKNARFLFHAGNRQENHIILKNNLFDAITSGINLDFDGGDIKADISGNTFIITDKDSTIFSASGYGSFATKQDYFIKGNYFQGLGDRDIEDFIYDSEDRRENKINLEVVENLTEPAASTPKN